MNEFRSEINCRVRLTNPKVQSAVVDTEGGVELLIACGFQIVFEGKERTFAEESAAAPADEAGQPSTGSTAEAPALAAGDRDGTGPQNSSLEGNSQQQAEEEEGYAVLPPDADLEPIHAALSLLRPFLPPTASPAPITALAPSQQGSTPVQQRVGRPRQWAEPCERHTRVILPVHPSTDVPQWFFDGTGAELKASFMAAVKRRQDSQVLMTKAMRERQQAQRHGAANGAGVNAAIVKVRLPEAIAVQGVFNAGEPVAAVFAWVASCLADPMQTYELVLPDRTVLSQQFGLENSPVKGPRGAGSGGPGAWRTQSVKEAGMAPSVTVNLRWTGASAEVMKRMPALRAELLRDADSGEACS